MKYCIHIAIVVLLSLYFVACNTSSNDTTQYPDDEDIMYIETDSLLAESNIEQVEVSRNSKLSKGYRRTFNDKNDVHLSIALRVSKDR